MSLKTRAVYSHSMNSCPNKFILFLLIAFSSSCSKSDAKKLFNAGDSKYTSGDYAGAIAEFDNAIQIDPNYIKAYNNRGMAKDALKDEVGAIADYTKAIELNPKYQFGYYNLGNAEVNLKDYTNAITDYEKAIELNPQDTAAYLNCGNLANHPVVCNGFRAVKIDLALAV